MGFFARLFSQPDPTRGWVADPNLRLVCDLSIHALAGISLGHKVEALSVLGPPEIPEAARRDMYCYPSRGFEFDAEGGRVDAIVIDCEAPEGGPYRRFEGSFIYQGKPVPLGPQTHAEDFVRTFGAPYWKDEDEDELILFYEFENGVEWQIEFTRAGRLTGLLLVTPPLLSDPDVREAYRVTQPWPPQGINPRPRPPGPDER